MSDIFISYASADRERAQVFAQVLAEQGWTVWWDRAIPVGRQFDEVIEEALDAARCVVVLWSSTSVRSNWVKTESAEAMSRRVLVPVLIEDVKIPLEFRRLQAANLSHWRGDRADEGLAQFLQAVAARLSGEEAPATVEPLAPEAPVPPRVAPMAPPSEATALEAGPQRQAPVPRGADANPPSSRTPWLALAGGGLALLLVVLVTAALVTGRQGEAPIAQPLQGGVTAEPLVMPAASGASPAPLPTPSGAAPAPLPVPESADASPAPLATPSGSESRPVPASGQQALEWHDHILSYRGQLSWSPAGATLAVTVSDMGNRTVIGPQTVNAMVERTGPQEYVVSAEFYVPGDSTTPGPHTHLSRLLLRANQDGSLRLLRNCPRPGECY